MPTCAACDTPTLSRLCRFHQRHPELIDRPSTTQAPGAPPERVAELAAMPWPDLVAYCDRVLDRLVDAMLLTRDDTRRAT